MLFLFLPFSSLFSLPSSASSLCLSVCLYSSRLSLEMPKLHYWRWYTVLFSTWWATSYQNETKHITSAKVLRFFVQAYGITFEKKNCCNILSRERNFRWKNFSKFYL
jgi:hypothetical protein